MHTFSDDNSSVQSSPWQRDHSSKQPCPRKNISSEMNFYYWKQKKIKVVGNGKNQRNEKKPLLSIIKSLIERNFQIRYVTKHSLVIGCIWELPNLGNLSNTYVFQQKKRVHVRIMNIWLYIIDFITLNIFFITLNIFFSCSLCYWTCFQNYRILSQQ